MKIGDIVKVKTEWLDDGENPNKLYMVKDIWSLNDGGITPQFNNYRGEFQELEPSTNFGCSSWVWDIKMMYVYMTKEEWQKMAISKLEGE